MTFFGVAVDGVSTGMDFSTKAPAALCERANEVASMDGGFFSALTTAMPSMAFGDTAGVEQNSQSPEGLSGEVTKKTVRWNRQLSCHTEVGRKSSVCETLICTACPSALGGMT